jgi:phosphoribosylpyrophosphate synthetase
MSDIKLLAGNSNRALAESIAAYLGAPLTKAQVRRFADMEVFVEIQENVRGQDTFIIQSTSFPANDHGIADHDGCSAPCFSPSHHSRRALFRLRPPRS